MSFNVTEDIEIGIVSREFVPEIFRECVFFRFLYRGEQSHCRSRKHRVFYTVTGIRGDTTNLFAVAAPEICIVSPELNRAC